MTITTEATSGKKKKKRTSDVIRYKWHIYIAPHLQGSAQKRKEKKKNGRIRGS